MITRRTPALGGIFTLAVLLSGCQSYQHVAEVPPPPPAPPLPAPERLVQAPGPWGIYFDLDKAEIRPEGAIILDQVVAAYRQFGRSVITLDGHGDTTGPSQYNLDLGQRRSEAVKAYLISKGVFVNSIATATQGEREPLVRTPDEVRERRNRRVEITFGPA